MIQELHAEQFPGKRDQIGLTVLKNTFRLRGFGDTEAPADHLVELGVGLDGNDFSRTLSEIGTSLP